MGFFDRDVFDFDGDGKTNAFEAEVELQMMAGSRQEAIALTGDDASIQEAILWKRMKMNVGKLWKMQGWIRMIMMNFDEGQETYFPAPSLKLVIIIRINPCIFQSFSAFIFIHIC